MTTFKNGTQQAAELSALKKRVAELERREGILLNENKYLYELFDRSPLGYQSLDGNGCLLEINRAWLDLLGYSKEEVIGRNFGDFLGSGWRDQFKTNFPRLKMVGEILGFEFEMIKKDGSVLQVNLDGRVGKNTKGEFQQTYCIIKDITQQKKNEVEREKLQSQLLHSQKMESIGRLAGGFAHDFNNILSSVIGYAEIVLDDELPHDSPARDSLQAILDAGLRAKNLVDLILTFSRQTKIRKQVMALGPVVTEALKPLRASLPANIDIRQSILTENTAILGNPAQIRQIFTNLGANAGAAMRESGGTLDVAVSAVQFSPEDGNRPFYMKHGPYVEITFADNGSGIDPAILDKIFDPFFSTKPKEEKTGLGLSLVYGIVKNHDGAIIVNSVMNKGTVFKIYFPQLTHSEEGHM